jgi:hypothetical protein
LFWNNGGSTTNIALLTGTSLLTYTVVGVNSGSTYKFTVRARNIYGTGLVSNELSVSAIDVPSKMTSPTVTLSSTTPFTDVIIAWSAPNYHNSAITAYSILFKKADGTYNTILSTCNGADSTIMSTLQCTVSMATI